VPKFGGVDPLGLRQINFDLMDQVLPGLNNVARHIRPFVVASAWRRANQLAQSGGMKTISFNLLHGFRRSHRGYLRLVAASARVWLSRWKNLAPVAENFRVACGSFIQAVHHWPGEGDDHHDKASLGRLFRFGQRTGPNWEHISINRC
jgi:hypothetical protein